MSSKKKRENCLILTVRTRGDDNEVVVNDNNGDVVLRVVLEEASKNRARLIFFSDESKLKINRLSLLNKIEASRTGYADSGPDD